MSEQSLFEELNDNEGVDIASIFGGSAQGDSDTNPFPANAGTTDTPEPTTAAEQSAQPAAPDPVQEPVQQTAAQPATTEQPAPPASAAPVADPLQAAFQEKAAQEQQAAAQSLFEKAPVFAYGSDKDPIADTPISLAYNKMATGCPPNCSFQVMCEPGFLQMADVILAITEQEAIILSQYYHVNSNKIVVTGRSVDAVFHDPVRDCNGKPKGMASFTTSDGIQPESPWWISGAYIFLGRIVPIKGPSEIIRAYSPTNGYIKRCRKMCLRV